MRRLNLLWMALLGLSWASVVPACSDNETEQSDAGAGGSSGDGGVGGAGPTSNSTNTTSGGGGTGSSEIGLQCASSQDCQTGLECLTSRSNSLNAGGPAHGFCSFKCG